MKSAILQSKKLWISFALVLIIAAGYCSNALTIDACERDTRTWGEQQLSASQWPQRYSQISGSSFAYPWIVDVEYAVVLGNTGGEWGRRRFICLFGLAIPVGKKVSVQS